MIRFLAIITFIFLFLVCTLPLLLVFWLLHKRFPEKIDRLSFAIVQWALRGVTWLAGTEVIVLGKENIPQGKPVLYIGNHTSFFDIIIPYTLVPDLTGYVSKKSMEKFPGLNFWMVRMHCLFLDRSNVKEGLKTILSAIDKVKNGISIFIFPEGTRNKTPETLMEFKGGSFKIAEKSGCPIIPVTMVNMSDIFEDHLPRVKKTRVVIEFGSPIDMNTLDREDKKHIGAYVQNVIAETYKKNKELYFK